MESNESSEDYLERILMLEGEKGRDLVHSVDLANSFGYSKPSISVAMKKLKEGGYLSFGPRDELVLTEAGRKKASEIYERHNLVGDLFVALGVPKDIAFKDACHIEHILSPETYAALKKHFDEKVK
ncbi:MAG: metal-dependent transcriptional regulator [Bacilli bacterium]|jgi:Mn-dependent DtxR family transcriptional regulator|nr:metal-dependent transcriptional regulator [Bacilli bacterium]MCI2111630.1 metal-dependent transcriptional regulator [Bacilli bacterium]